MSSSRESIQTIRHLKNIHSRRTGDSRLGAMVEAAQSYSTLQLDVRPFPILARDHEMIRSRLGRLYQKQKRPEIMCIKVY